MSAERTAYAVTSGEYSDYTVHAVFESKADAEHACRLRRSDSYHDRYSVEPMLWFPADTQATMVTTYTCMATLWDDGTVSQHDRTHEPAPLEVLREPAVRTEPIFDTLWGVPPKRPKVEFVRAPCHNGKAGRLEVRGSSRTAVVKAFNDRVMQHLAGQRMKQTR